MGLNFNLNYLSSMFLDIARFEITIIMCANKKVWSDILTDWKNHLWNQVGRAIIIHPTREK